MSGSERSKEQYRDPKEEERKAKERASAKRSRKRKKAYYESLTDENSKLKAEVESLKKELGDLKEELERKTTGDTNFTVSVSRSIRELQKLSEGIISFQVETGLHRAFMKVYEAKLAEDQGVPPPPIHSSPFVVQLVRDIVHNVCQGEEARVLYEYYKTSEPWFDKLWTILNSMEVHVCHLDELRKCYDDVIAKIIAPVGKVLEQIRPQLYFQQAHIINTMRHQLAPIFSGKNLPQNTEKWDINIKHVQELLHYFTGMKISMSERYIPPSGPQPQPPPPSQEQPQSPPPPQDTPSPPSNTKTTTTTAATKPTPAPSSSPSPVKRRMRYTLKNAALDDTDPTLSSAKPRKRYVVPRKEVIIPIRPREHPPQQIPLLQSGAHARLEGASHQVSPGNNDTYPSGTFSSSGVSIPFSTHDDSPSFVGAGLGLGPGNPASDSPGSFVVGDPSPGSIPHPNPASNLPSSSFEDSSQAFPISPAFSSRSSLIASMQWSPLSSIESSQRGLNLASHRFPSQTNVGTRPTPTSMPNLNPNANRNSNSNSDPNSNPKALVYSSLPSHHPQLCMPPHSSHGADACVVSLSSPTASATTTPLRVPLSHLLQALSDSLSSSAESSSNTSHTFDNHRDRNHRKIPSSSVEPYSDIGGCMTSRGIISSATNTNPFYSRSSAAPPVPLPSKTDQAGYNTTGSRSYNTTLTSPLPTTTTFQFHMTDPICEGGPSNNTSFPTHANTIFLNPNLQPNVPPAMTQSHPHSNDTYSPQMPPTPSSLNFSQPGPSVSAVPVSPQALGLILSDILASLSKQTGTPLYISPTNQTFLSLPKFTNLTNPQSASLSSSSSSLSIDPLAAVAQTSSLSSPVGAPQSLKGNSTAALSAVVGCNQTPKRDLESLHSFQVPGPSSALTESLWQPTVGLCESIPSPELSDPPSPSLVSSWFR